MDQGNCSVYATPSCITLKRLDDTDRAFLEQATKDAWAEAERVTEGRLPRFGYRPVPDPKFASLAGHLDLRPDADMIAFLAGWEACRLSMEEETRE